VGNRAQGDRLPSLVDFEALKLAASAVLMSPYVPLLFMGEEYGERAPFLFFTDFGDPELREAVRRGRREEFTAFAWTGEMPDPQDPTTFARSKLKWSLRNEYPYRWLLDCYHALLALRRQYPALGVGGKRRLQIQEPDDHTLAVFRQGPDGSATFGVLHFSPEAGTVRLRLPRGPWRRLVDTAEERFGGLGAKSPALLSLPRGGWAEIEIGAYGAAIFLREAVAAATELAKASRDVAPEAVVPNAA
jgi:maltooligosyltrehalose trehalohydrolase